jgi:hypothetical protein
MRDSSKVLQVVSLREEDAVKVAHVDFCIRSDSLDPKAITLRLGIKPTRSWAKGEKYTGKAFNPKTRKVVQVRRTHPWGIWALNSAYLSSAKRVEQHVLCLLRKLEPKKALLQRYLADHKRYALRFVIWWEPLDAVGSYSLSSDVLKRMARLSHCTEFDFIGTE